MNVLGVSILDPFLRFSNLTLELFGHCGIFGARFFFIYQIATDI
jgi:hypothetical protein